MFSRFIRALRHDEFGVQLMTLLPLVYMGVCTYTSLFQVSAFNFNKLVPGATTGPCLMQNGSLMCRFAAPTCWNFLHVIHMETEQNGACRLPLLLLLLQLMDCCRPGVDLNQADFGCEYGLHSWPLCERCALFALLSPYKG